MLVRVVDYIANPGGGVRFTTELLSALVSRSAARFEIVSTGAGLDAYRSAIQEGPQIGFKDVRPVRAYLSRTHLAGIPGARLLNAILGTGRFYYVVSRSVVEGADVTWFPWVHRHRLQGDAYSRAVGSLHDVIALDFDGILSARHRGHEKETLRRWLASPAPVVVSSRATRSRLQALFGVSPERVEIVPLSGRHARAVGARRGAAWPFESGSYFIAPINLTAHKNYEGLLRGFAKWGGGAKCPLVVTGWDTDIWQTQALHGRSRDVRRLGDSLGLRPDVDVFALGYQDESTYDALLKGARALVMPTLAEGGGSFPVWEAIEAGIPVITSDIAPIREMVELIGAQVLWFDPLRPDELAARLADMDRDYERLKANAIEQVGRIKPRTWPDVARDYARILGLELESEEASGPSVGTR